MGEMDTKDFWRTYVKGFLATATVWQGGDKSLRPEPGALPTAEVDQAGDAWVLKHYQNLREAPQPPQPERAWLFLRAELAAGLAQAKLDGEAPPPKEEGVEVIRVFLIVHWHGELKQEWGRRGSGKGGE